MKLRVSLILPLLLFVITGCQTTGAGQSGTITSDDGLYTITLDNHWETLGNVNKKASLQAVRRDNRGYLIVYTAPYEQLRGNNLDELAGRIAESMADELNNGDVSKPVYGQIGNMRSVVYLITGRFKETAISNWLFIIKGEQALYIAKAWCATEDFDRIGDDLFKTVQTLREI